MSPEAQRVAILKKMGWTETERWLDGRRRFERADSHCGWNFDDLPDYLNDLNAMRVAEKVLTEKQGRTYAFILAQVLDTAPSVDLHDQFINIHATAAQRAEAFLRTIGKWEASK